MHSTELTPELIAKLKEHVEVNSEGHVLTKKINFSYTVQPDNHKIKQFSSTLLRTGDTKTKVGKRRGTKTKYGQTFYFSFPATQEKIICKARELVWVFNNGVYDPKMKVQPKNGNLFDDRIENLHLVKNNNGGRPVGAKDKIKREKRDKLNAKQERKVIKLRKDGLTTNQIAETMETSYNVVRSALERAVKSKRLKRFFNTQTFKGKITNDGCQIGVYVLYASSLESKKFISKGYIGSSRNVWKRNQDHFSHLKKDKHYNKDMQEAYNSGNYIFSTFWLERGEFDHGEELVLETEHINKYERASLFNKWSQPSLEEIQPYLDKYKHYLDDESRYTVDENGCWNWNHTKPDGYSKEIRCTIEGKIKYIKPHRLSYYKVYGEYPELIRHMCDNRACVNPKCLQKGSYQENGLDRNREFRKDFEYWWLRHEGDVTKLTNHFDFKYNQHHGSTQIYYWERQLGLREKYEDIFYARNHFLTPEERAAIQAKKEQKQQQKKDRQDHVESLRGTAHNLARRYSATKTDVSKFLGLTFQEVSSLMSDVEPLNYNAVREISEPYGDYENKCLYAPEMIRNFPHLKRDIEDCYAREIFRDEWESYRNFLLQKYK